MSRRSRATRIAARVFLRARRLLAATWVWLAVAAVAALIAVGAFRGLWSSASAPGSHSLASLCAALGLGALVVARLAAYLAVGRRIGSATAELRADLETGAVLVVATWAAVEATGGPRSLLYPLVYALIAFLVTFHRHAVGLPLIALAVALELATWRVAADGESPRVLATHLVFIAFFAVVHTLFLQAEMLRQRRAHRALLASEVTRTREEARDFRLISSQLGADSRTRSRPEEERKLAQGAVETIHDALYYNLDLLKKTLELHTCVLLWLDDTGERLRVKELVTDADGVVEGAFPSDAGATGSVVKTRQTVRLAEPKRGHLPYYAVGGTASTVIAELLAVPVLEDGHLRGVLCADRSTACARRFTTADESLLAGAARQIMRVIQGERVFTAVERAKYEHERFYTASSLLNRALGPEQVFATAFRAAREICEFDFAAITLFDKTARRHTVAAVDGDCGGTIAADGSESFGDNAGLVAMVVKNRHFLPAAGELRDKDTPVFTKKIKLRGIESLLVLPLIAADEAIGTFVIASKASHFFGKDKRELLGVIANQVAVSAKNAEMYRAMEEMATTDGLTGLVNHRTFQVRTADLLSRAERQGGKLTLLLTDVDHFKKVNDTYGHPIGDQVLKAVAAVCRAQVRKIDVAARYGGEEFAIVLDGTDLAGARVIAERIRTEIEKQQHASEKGPFQCTLSLGIASFPDDGRDPKTLIGRADEALYFAKHNGRNRSVAWVDAHAPASPALRAVR